MEHPILFSGEMVRAILEGRKTQTRRVIKPQPDRIRESPFVPSGLETIHGYPLRCPYGIPGDPLWVRESWKPIHHKTRMEETYVRYRADDGLKSIKHTMKMDVPTKWRPSIHMPRWASRITLEVVEIHAQQLHNISVLDARAEGIAPQHGRREVEDYIVLWNSINAKRGLGWDTNPWVWVIEFKVKNGR